VLGLQDVAQGRGKGMKKGKKGNRGKWKCRVDRGRPKGKGGKGTTGQKESWEWALTKKNHEKSNHYHGACASRAAITPRVTEADGSRRVVISSHLVLVFLFYNRPDGSATPAMLFPYAPMLMILYPALLPVDVSTTPILL
jgi:hypothetical protein